MLRRIAHRSLSTLAVACLALGVAAGPAAAGTQPLPSSGTVRWAGADRYATAVAVSQHTFTAPVPVAYVASGATFPDALSAAPAAATEGGPVLLAQRDVLPDVVRTELTRLRPGRIVVVGGPSAVSDAVLAALRAYTTGTVDRRAGTDRYGTSAAVATSSFAGRGGTAYLATGQNFPDALSAAAVAGREHAPVLLSPPAAVPAAVLDALAAVRPSRVVLLGSTTVLSDAVRAQLAGSGRLPGATYERWAGSDRYGTSAAVVAHAFPGTAATAYLAVGTQFPDALAGSPSAALEQAPVLLAQPTCLPPATYLALQRLQPSTRVLLGSSSALSSTAPTTQCGPAPFPSSSVTCAAFATQPQAQKWFDYYKPSYGDVARLDPDGDGKVCLALPSPSSFAFPVPVSVGNATQVVTVKARGSYATVIAWQWSDASGWRQVTSTTAARVGANGVVAGATRKQNTYTTPSGTYPMTQAFGVAANPGTAMPYLHAGSCDWWDEDQRSRFYNEHVDACTTRTDYALTTTGTYSSEHLVDFAGQYRYAVVVDFNRPDPVPGRGAGIFLHVNGTGATAGCVSVPLATMTTVIRWLSPGQHPRIAIA